MIRDSTSTTRYLISDVCGRPTRSDIRHRRLRHKTSSGYLVPGSGHTSIAVWRGTVGFPSSGNLLFWQHQRKQYFRLDRGGLMGHPPRSERKYGPSSRTSFRHVASGCPMRNPGTPGRPRVSARSRGYAGDRAYSRASRTREPGLRGTPRNLTPECTHDCARVLPRCAPAYPRVTARTRANVRAASGRDGRTHWRTGITTGTRGQVEGATYERCPPVRPDDARRGGPLATRIDIEGEASRHGRRDGGSNGHSSCITEDSDSAERGWNGAERGTSPERKSSKEGRNIWARNGAVPRRRRPSFFFFDLPPYYSY